MGFVLESLSFGCAWHLQAVLGPPPVPAPWLDAAVSLLHCWGRRNAPFSWICGCCAHHDLLRHSQIPLLMLPLSPLGPVHPTPSPFDVFQSWALALLHLCSAGFPCRAGVRIMATPKSSCASAGLFQLSCKGFNPGDCAPRAGSSHTKGHLVHPSGVQTAVCQELCG